MVNMVSQLCINVFKFSQAAASTYKFSLSPLSYFGRVCFVAQGVIREIDMIRHINRFNRVGFSSLPFWGCGHKDTHRNAHGNTHGNTHGEAKNTHGNAKIHTDTHGEIHTEKSKYTRAQYTRIHTEI